MSKDELTQFANQDTPAGVTVPASWTGLAMWMMGRWGLGVAAAVVFGFALAQVYDDMREVNERVLVAFEAMAKQQEANAAALRELTKAVEGRPR